MRRIVLVSRVDTAGGRQPCRVIGSAHDRGLCRTAPVVDSGRRTRLDSPVSMSGAEVLIAADDPRFVTELMRELERQGHDVTTCFLVTEALAHVSETEYDLVVVESRGGDRLARGLLCSIADASGLVPMIGPISTSNLTQKENPWRS